MAPHARRDAMPAGRGMPRPYAGQGAVKVARCGYDAGFAGADACAADST